MPRLIGVDAAPDDRTTAYEYDRDRRLTAVTLPSGQRMEHSYDDGRHVSTTTPEGVIEYDYLCGGRVSQITKAAKASATTGTATWLPVSTTRAR
ncbi:YD repeat-containing protein [Natronospira proteinivora]|uniref:YD repeat-containing protein n=1 Tax=Natronospira proteinivora TaxID=1807133 RepID=A0ABT1G9R2_9GAMM|nr:YD repeat-containing protein [Natronospira proteinivora]